MDTIQTLKIDVVLNGKKAQIGLKQLYKQLKGIEKPVKSINGLFGKMLKIAGFTGFAKMAFDAQKLGRELGLISDKTGIAASKISRMQSAFSATGGDAKSLSNALASITSGLSRISVGDASMASRLAAMNISAWDGSGGLKKADVVLGEIADWSKRQIDMGHSLEEVSQYLQDNFGIQQDLANQLTLGQSGFFKYQEDMAKRVGYLQEDEIDNLKSLNISFSRLKTTIGVLIDKTFAALGPVLEFFMDLLQIASREFQDVVVYVVNVFKDIVGSGEELEKLFEGLSVVLFAIKVAFMGVVDVIAGFLKAVKLTGEFITYAITRLLQFLRDSWLGRKIFGDNIGGWAVEEKDMPKTDKAVKGKSESLFPKVDRPTFPVLFGEGGDVTKTSNNNQKNIEIVIETTNNMNGQVNQEDLKDVVGEAIYKGVDILLRAATGRY